MSRRKPVRRETIVQPPTERMLRYMRAGLAGFGKLLQKAPSRAAWRSPPLNRPRLAGERPIEVAPQVFDVLDSRRKAQEVGRAGRVGSLDRGAVLDQPLDAAERCRPPP